MISRCEGGLVRVVSASPAQGFQVDGDDDRDGDTDGDTDGDDLDDHPSVKFRSSEHDVEVRLRCVDGTPAAEIR